MIFKYRTQLAFCHRLHHFTPGKHKTLLVLVSDNGVKFLDEVLRFLNSGPRHPLFGYFHHIESKAHVGLFLLYSTSSTCHSS